MKFLNKSNFESAFIWKKLLPWLDLFQFDKFLNSINYMHVSINKFVKNLEIQQVQKELYQLVQGLYS